MVVDKKRQDMSELSKPLQEFWNNQIKHHNVKAAPFSGFCMFCNKLITEKDKDHSVCNKC
jgi:hypothetical protein